jgi:hypothetical protein
MDPGFRRDDDMAWPLPVLLLCVLGASVVSLASPAPYERCSGAVAAAARSVSSRSTPSASATTASISAAPSQ